MWGICLQKWKHGPSSTTLLPETGARWPSVRLWGIGRLVRLDAGRRYYRWLPPSKKGRIVISTNTAVASLQFDPANLEVGDKKDIRDGLSAIASDGRNLWLACDEGCRLERLTRDGSGFVFGSHRDFPLSDLIHLPVPRKAGEPEAEADVEGMDVDDGWLWLVGSHSVKRKNPKADDAPDEIAAKLQKISRDGNRHLLARIPLDDGVVQRRDGSRQAAGIATSVESSALLDAIKDAGDKHLLPFLPLPGKDNGLDIEGLAVRGTRAFVGLRGPVLRGWSCILELRLEANDDTLELLPVDKAVPYRKHFHNLNNLGIRDLVFVEDDLLVLAGPTQSHDGPHEIWRWKNAGKQSAAGDRTCERVLVLPQRDKVDRAEGITMIDRSGSSASLLVVYDTPDKDRVGKKDGSVTADVVRL